MHANSLPQLKLPLSPTNPFVGMSFNYQNHSTIYIKGNENFSNTAAEEGWNGNGTAAAPYIIEGLQIFGSSNDTLIRIKSTDVYFQIANCRLAGGANGIYLTNVTHGTISLSNITGTTLYGIYLVNSHNNTLKDNIVTHNKDGINLFTSDNNTVINNRVTNNFQWGIHTFRSGWLTNPFRINYGSFNTLIGNVISDNGDDGLFLDHSWFGVIMRNIITRNGRNGVSAYLSGENLLANNTISRNGNHGIQVELGENDTISNNAIVNSTGYGIRFLGDGLYNRVEWNDVLGNNPSGICQAWDDINYFNVYKHNYWADWTSPDGNSDGIVDRAYPIEGREKMQIGEEDPIQDPAPLVAPSHLAPLTILLPNKTEKPPDPPFIISWTAVNDSLGHSITYAVYYSTDGGKKWLLITSDRTSTAFDWNVITTANGSNYAIKVVAVCSEGFAVEDASESDLANSKDDFPWDVFVSGSILVLVLLVIGGGVGGFVWRMRRISSSRN
jgi:parallel beta-helix repeat protein